MSVFSRSRHGISNYPKFFGCDFTVFTEGKSVGTQIVDDISYYETVFRIASNGRKPKIICVGNKFSALEYAKKICTENLKNSIVVVDKDLEGIISSPLEIYPVIRTSGYSWENEFWTNETITGVLEIITNQKGLNDLVSKDIEYIKKQLRYISSLDAGLQITGSNLLPKDSKLCGVNVSFPKITIKEIKRLSNKYKTSTAFQCDIAREIVANSLRKNPEEVIQGHFWSNVCLKYICNYFKKIHQRNSTCSSNNNQYSIFKFLYKSFKIHWR